MGSWFSTADIQLDLREADIGYRVPVEDTIESFISLLKRYKGKVVVITGAGISSHKLPTFRSNNKSGLWESYSPQILARESFYDEPDSPWKLVANIRDMQIRRLLYPSLAHHALHFLLQAGYINGIVTQNIDSLHSFQSDIGKVVELHGVISDRGICERCHADRTVESLTVLRTGVAPKCSVCGAVLKPSIAFYGDEINAKQREEAGALLQFANVVVLIGTHCTVDPVLSLVTDAKRSGCVLVEINIAKTPASKFMDMSLIESADGVLKKVVEALIPGVDMENLNLEEWDAPPDIFPE